MNGLAYEGQIYKGEIYNHNEMLQGSECMMCQSIGKELGNPKNPPCCWCLGRGVIPSRKERRLDSATHCNGGAGIMFKIRSKNV